MNLALLFLTFAGAVSATASSGLTFPITTFSHAAYSSQITATFTLGENEAEDNTVKIVLPDTTAMANGVDVAETTTVDTYTGAQECNGGAVAVKKFQYDKTSRKVTLTMNALCASGTMTVVLKGVHIFGVVDPTTGSVQGQTSDPSAAFPGSGSVSYGTKLTALASIAFTPAAPIINQESTITITFTPPATITSGTAVTVSYPGISTMIGSVCSYGSTAASTATTVVGTTTGYFTFTSTAEATGTSEKTLVCTKVTFAAAVTAAVSKGAGLAYGTAASAASGYGFIDSVIVTNAPTAAPFSSAPTSAATSAFAFALCALVALFV